MRTKGVVSFVAIVLSAVSLGAAGAELRLIDAAKRSDVAAVRALVAQGLDVNARAGDGATALHWAAYRGRVPLATHRMVADDLREVVEQTAYLSEQDPDHPGG